MTTTSRVASSTATIRDEAMRATMIVASTRQEGAVSAPPTGGTTSERGSALSTRGTSRAGTQLEREASMHGV